MTKCNHRVPCTVINLEILFSSAYYIQCSIKSSFFRTHVYYLIILFQKHHILELKIDNILTKVRTQIRGEGVFRPFRMGAYKGGGGSKMGHLLRTYFMDDP